MSLYRTSRWMAGAGLCAAVLAQPASAKSRNVDVSPYIQISQVLSADLTNGGDVLTYTDVAAGIDGSVQTRRVQATVSYRYERRISETRGLGDDDLHTGIARAAVGLTPALSLEGGALATRSRVDGRGVQPDG